MVETMLSRRCLVGRDNAVETMLLVETMLSRRCWLVETMLSRRCLVGRDNAAVETMLVGRDCRAVETIAKTGRDFCETMRLLWSRRCVRRDDAVETLLLSLWSCACCGRDVAVTRGRDVRWSRRLCCASRRCGRDNAVVETLWSRQCCGRDLCLVRLASRLTVRVRLGSGSGPEELCGRRLNSGAVSRRYLYASALRCISNLSYVRSLSHSSFKSARRDLHPSTSQPTEIVETETSPHIYTPTNLQFSHINTIEHST